MTRAARHPVRAWQGKGKGDAAGTQLFSGKELRPLIRSYSLYLKVPPSGSHSVGEGYQAEPSQALWYMLSSVPSPKMSSRFGPQLTATGGLSNRPPSGSQLVGEGYQAEPSQALWYMLLSVPNPKISRRFGPHATTAGG